MSRDALTSILTVLSPADMHFYTPVQVQKLLFLIQDRVPKIIKEKFDFQAAAYGPFDITIYDKLEELQKNGDLLIQAPDGLLWKVYSLTAEGLEKGTKSLNTLEEGDRRTIILLSEFVRKLGFSSLVSSIYKAYPEMRENSVFKREG